MPYLLCGTEGFPFWGQCIGEQLDSVYSLPGVAFCPMEHDFFVWSCWASSYLLVSHELLRLRCAGLPLSVGVLKDLDVCCWDTGKQILSLRRKLLLISDPVGKKGLADVWVNSSSCWCSARPGRVWAETPAKPSLRARTAPKLVVFEAVIYPNKEKQWFC